MWHIRVFVGLIIGSTINSTLRIIYVMREVKVMIWIISSSDLYSYIISISNNKTLYSTLILEKKLDSKWVLNNEFFFIWVYFILTVIKPQFDKFT